MLLYRLSLARSERTGTVAVAGAKWAGDVFGIRSIEVFLGRKCVVPENVVTRMLEVQQFHAVQSSITGPGCGCEAKRC